MPPYHTFHLPRDSQCSSSNGTNCEVRTKPFSTPTNSARSTPLSLPDDAPTWTRSTTYRGLEPAALATSRKSKPDLASDGFRSAQAQSMREMNTDRTSLQTARETAFSLRSEISHETFHSSFTSRSTHHLPRSNACAPLLPDHVRPVPPPFSLPPPRMPIQSTHNRNPLSPTTLNWATYPPSHQTLRRAGPSIPTCAGHTFRSDRIVSTALATRAVTPCASSYNLSGADAQVARRYMRVFERLDPGDSVSYLSPMPSSIFTRSVVGVVGDVDERSQSYYSDRAGGGHRGNVELSVDPLRDVGRVSKRLRALRALKRLLSTTGRLSNEDLPGDRITGIDVEHHLRTSYEETGYVDHCQTAIDPHVEPESSRRKNKILELAQHCQERIVAWRKKRLRRKGIKSVNAEINF